MVRKANKSKNKFVTIITSNYDYSVEWNLLDWGEGWDVDKIIDYGFSWREPILASGKIHNRPMNPKYKIYKLHGSSDWLKCERCGYIYINPTMAMYQLAFVNYKNDANMCHCGYWPLKPVLVTPSFARFVIDTNLHEIWKTSLEQLRTAHEWMIIGYSLPPEDLNIIFLRADHGRENKPVISVIQKNNDTKKRFDNFFGQGNYHFHKDGLEQFDFLSI